MSQKIIFHSPAHQAEKDFSGNPEGLEAFQNAWNTNLQGWTESSIIGNPWSNQNDAPRAWYYNPAENDQGWPSRDPAPILWTPFPNRLMTFYGPGSNPAPGGQLTGPLSKEQVWKLADNGEITVEGTGKTYQFWSPDPKASDILKVPEIRCPEIDWDKDWGDFSPPGPRGWLDEYCEWSITWENDTPGSKILSIMFTCENPAYWFTMWHQDPDMVVALYQKYIDAAVKLDDLVLKYPEGSSKAGQAVIDPTTNRPAYNPTNKWNNSTLKLDGQSGGAIHLTSPPNTLSAEIYLAAAASIQREDEDGNPISSTNPQALICCAQYGQNFRNSDPHIGAVGNGVAGSLMYSLSDPVGLYIQTPNWSVYETPDGTPASDFWTVARGEVGGGSGKDSILHAVFEVPSEKGYTVSDITINGEPIQWAGQIAETIQIALRVTPKQPSPGDTNPRMHCVAPQPDSSLQPWPAQFVSEALFEGGSPTSLPARLAPGTTNTMVLVVQGASKDTTVENARVQFDDGSVSAKVSKYLPDASSIPGQTNSGGTQAYILETTIEPGAKIGAVGIRALNPYEETNPSAKDHPYEYGLLQIVASDS